MSDRIYLDNVNPDLWSKAWEAQSCADQQGQLALEEVSQWKNGQPIKPFDVFREMLGAIFGLRSDQFSLLEVGCGTGHYSHVLWHIAPQASYTGLDYSAAMLKTAASLFDLKGPCVTVRGEAERLPFANETYDIVVLGSVIGCCRDWCAAIREAFRVSRKYVLIHRIAAHNYPDWPDVRDSVKSAYGVEMAERIIRDSFLHSVAKGAGARCVRNSWAWSKSDHGFQLSILFEK